MYTYYSYNFQCIFIEFLLSLKIKIKKVKKTFYLFLFSFYSYFLYKLVCKNMLYYLFLYSVNLIQISTPFFELNLACFNTVFMKIVEHLYLFFKIFTNLINSTVSTLSQTRLIVLRKRCHNLFGHAVIYIWTFVLILKHLKKKSCINP